jgi:dynein heavy chain
MLTLQLKAKGAIKFAASSQEINFFIRGERKPSPPSPYGWLSQASWEMVNALAEIEDYATLPQNITKDFPNRFRDWVGDSRPEDSRLPHAWWLLDNSPFKKLCVLKCLRPDRLARGLEIVIERCLPRGAELLALEREKAVKKCIEESDFHTPVLFILSEGGSDPYKSLERIREEKDKDKRFFSLSMGEGMEEMANRRL